MNVAALRWCFVAFIAVMPVPASAGAWTLPKGVTQIITSTTVSDADKSYDAHSDPTERVTFHKMFLSAYTEYGLRDWLTLIATPEYAIADSVAVGRAAQKANDFAISGGARVRLVKGSEGVLSLQATARSAGAFELDTSFNQDPGKDFELRALYGRHFVLLGRSGCVDLQIAQRWATGKRPNETPIDLTLIYDVGWKSRCSCRPSMSSPTAAGSRLSPITGTTSWHYPSCVRWGVTFPFR